MSATNMDGYLEGQLLVAMPTMGDTRFERAVIFMCAHSDEGAMGIVLNQPAEEVSFSDLLVQLDIVPEGEQIRLAVPEGNLPVHKGGPVETGRGFVLHSGDYFISDSTLAIDSEICLTATVEILKAIAEGRGPRRALLALGYAGWAPGSSRRKSSATAGSPVRRTRTSSSSPTSTRSTTLRSRRWASTRGCSPARPVPPDRPCAGRRGDARRSCPPPCGRLGSPPDFTSG